MRILGSRCAIRRGPLGRTVDRLKTLLVLLTITHRPEFESPWIGRRVAGNKAVPATLRQDIIERTDGIPLFVEEMTEAVVGRPLYLQSGQADDVLRLSMRQ